MKNSKFIFLGLSALIILSSQFIEGTNFRRFFILVALTILFFLALAAKLFIKK